MTTTTTMMMTNTATPLPSLEVNKVRQAQADQEWQQHMSTTTTMTAIAIAAPTPPVPPPTVIQPVLPLTPSDNLPCNFNVPTSSHLQSEFQVRDGWINALEITLNHELQGRINQHFRLYYNFASVISSMISGGNEAVNPMIFTTVFSERAPQFNNEQRKYLLLQIYCLKLDSYLLIN
jgi:hypothetical protein